MYGNPEAGGTPKRQKLDKEMRDELNSAVIEELCDISTVLHFKEKHLSQAEAAKSYRKCEQLTEEN